MKYAWKHRLAAAALAAGMLLTLPACGKQEFRPESAVDLTAQLAPASTAKAAPLAHEQAALLTDFGLRLMDHCVQDGQSILVSPLSVLTALGMTVNGGAGETLTEMESVLGMKRNALNQALSAYWSGLPESEKTTLRAANSLWVTDREDFTVNPDFLQTCTDFYDADIFQTAMDDAACREINRWVEAQTDGMIPELLDRLSPDAVMVLVNALAFHGLWEEPYEARQIREGVFLTGTGAPVTTELMHSEEAMYLENDVATGVVKPYKGGKYAFVGLLPKENRSPAELIRQLDGQSLQELLSNREDVSVQTIIPKYETTTTLELVDILRAMGMPLAFDETQADFSGLGSIDAGNIFLNRVLHKTFLSLTEEGTKAAAATAVEAVGGAAPMEEFREVFLDQPFVYLLVDTETWVPFFMGTMTDPTGDMTTVSPDALPMQVQVQGKLYQSTGRHSDVDGRCGTWDGEITSSVERSASPEQDDQSNFGIGWGYQRMSGGTIEVSLGRHWIVFEQLK